MSYIFGGAPTQGVGGQTTQRVMMADPDIAAQGAQQQSLLKQQNDYKNQRFGQVMPLFQQAMNGMAQSQRGLVGGDSGQGPHIPGGPIWSQDAVQQNLNANRAQIDQQTATNNKTMQGNMAGKGFGARSPLAMALEQQGAQSGMAQKADYAREFVPQTRQANATFGLQVGQAQENQFAQRQSEDIARRQALASTQNSLLQALGGLMG
jgi:hypothetical protein